MKDLNAEEKQLLESYERDEWQSVSDHRAEADRYRKYASATYKKDKRVNIRMSEKDLTAIQKKALEEGIPYQTGADLLGQRRKTETLLCFINDAKPMDIFPLPWHGGLSSQTHRQGEHNESDRAA